MFKPLPSNYLHCYEYDENSKVCNCNPGFECKKYLKLWTELQKI